MERPREVHSTPHQLQKHSIKTITTIKINIFLCKEGLSC